MSRQDRLYLPEMLPSPREGLTWPVLPNPRSAEILALLYQFEASQWLSAHELAERQQRQLSELLRYARSQCPYYQHTLAGENIPLTEIPLLTRRDLQERYAEICPKSYPASHGRSFQATTAGSTGEPVKLRRTQLSQMFWWASTLRDHLWHRRDFSGTMAVIRFFNHPVTSERPVNWGGSVFRGGPSWQMSISTDIDEQVDWLDRINPHYLLTYPTNLQALLALMESRQIKLPRLLEVRTISEALTDVHREACKRVFGVEVTDLYSSNELGIIALQCPESGLLHIQAENLLVEVLNEDGRPCEDGQVGQVVITDLHNFATPLIRYATGDYAEVGSVCPCGRGLPTLRRIQGRSRNRLALPGGKRVWTYLGEYRFREIVPNLRQYQMVQESLDSITVNLVMDGGLSPHQELALTAAIHSALRHSFILRFKCHNSILPRSPGGKFEDLISMV